MTTKIRLQKTLKEGLRRCVYRRWEAEIKGKVLITKTTVLERMYRGNTPYAVRPSIIRCFNNGTRREASAKMKRLTAQRLKAGFRKT